MIIGTAGHIDHGKTTLVQALTGTNADRLPEEKARGLTVELGYAFMDAPDGQRLAFVDVPGHERLVHTMISGAGGMDFALLLVAADDGPMPQTREHMAILSLLGIDQGAVAITKIDRCTPARVAEVQQQMTELLAATPLAGAPVLAVSATDGRGVQALRELLFAAAARQQEQADTASAPQTAFRLAIDRAFSLRGIGPVVTGTIHAGRVAVGDTLALAPARSGATAPALRVRSLHAQDQNVQSAHAGQRCAVAVGGAALAELQRGQWLVAPAVALATHRLDVQLTLWHGAPGPLRSGMRMQVHVGTARSMGSVVLLEGSTLEPGGTALAQLVLQDDVAAWRGARLLLRDTTSENRLAGAVLLDPFAPGRYRRTDTRLAQLHALTHLVPATRLQHLIESSPNGVNTLRFHTAAGLLAPPSRDPAADELAGGGFVLGAAYVPALRERTLAALQSFHDSQPDELGPDRNRLRRLVAPRLPTALWNALLQQMLAQDTLCQHGAIVHLPSHAITLSDSEARLAEQITPILREAGFQGVWMRDLARDTGHSETAMRTTLARLAQRGELHQVVRDLYFLPETMRALAALARQINEANDDAGVEAAQFRDATGLGRKRAIQILEYFDRLRFTRRVGDTHKLRTDSHLFIQGA